jgi:nucleoside-diphosphate-sugar epimerase
VVNEFAAVIFGAGFTGRRVALRLLRRGVRVVAGVRDPERVRDLISLGLEAVPLQSDADFPKGAALLHSIPPLPAMENTALRTLIEQIEPRRVVYLSTTGVYGEEAEVSEFTPAAPADPRALTRIDEERWIESHDWSTLVLRAAAIYGQGRGVHVSIRKGRVPRGSASGIVSRIHVDDLAALAEAGLFSELTGAWPVADDHPCATAEIVEWLQRQSVGEKASSPQIIFPVHGRKVNGAAIRNKLGIKIKYPSWHTGIPASIAEEG